MPSHMEFQMLDSPQRRQFGRLNIPQPALCQLYVPTDRERKGYKGLIKNISLEGVYFVCDEKPPLKKDDIRHLIFNIIYDFRKIFRLKFHGLIMRTENNDSQFGVAFKSLSDPIYYPLKEIKDQIPSLDKMRLMYQNYDLYKKAHELIQNTPDIRTAKIDNIKSRLDHNLYQIDPTKLARFMTINLTDNFENLAAEFYKKILK
jgi:hypothetical protein